jgi:hypothetical protein
MNSRESGIVNREWQRAQRIVMVENSRRVIESLGRWVEKTAMCVRYILALKTDSMTQ